MKVGGGRHKRAPSGHATWHSSLQRVVVGGGRCWYVVVGGLCGLIECVSGGGKVAGECWKVVVGGL